MSRQIISTMGNIVWSIDSRNDTIADLLDRMRNLALNTLSPNNVKISFETKGLNITKKLPIDKRQNIYLIFKETINNIARHAHAKNVNITFNIQRERNCNRPC